MKIHITNLYNLKKDDALVKKQHRFAEAGRELGFLEMGVFSYPVETDTAGELSKRLDGIIAALESQDLVFVQLPTGNGYDYEQRLINKIRAYQNTKIVLILHDMQILYDAADKEMQSKYLNLYKMADAVIVPTVSDAGRLGQLGLPKVLSSDDIQLPDMKSLSEGDGDIDVSGMASAEGYFSLCKSGFYLKKILMDAMEAVFAYEKELARSSTPASEDEVHIGFGLHDKTGNYSVWVGTAMQSIIEHTGAKICFHILHDNTLNELNRNRLMQVASGGGHRIRFHLLEPKLFSDVAEQIGGYTIGAMFRIMLPELLPELSKIIYLDADLLVNRDIMELWNMDIHNYYLAAVCDRGVVSGAVKPIAVKRKEVPADRYFNSGVLYMNLERIREKGNMKKEVLDYLVSAKESDLPDQDALNAIYNEGTLLLDGSWNYFARDVRRGGEVQLESKIYHYVGTPCILYSLTEMDRLYFETTGRTPWGMEECRRQLQNSLERTNDRVSQLEKLISQIAGPYRKRIFYGEETYAMRNLYRLLTVQEGDYRVSVERKEESDGILPCKELSVLSEEKDSFVVFVLPEADGGSAIGRLEQLGLKNGKDFFVIPRLLSSPQGGYVL